MGDERSFWRKTLESCSSLPLPFSAIDQTRGRSCHPRVMSNVQHRPNQPLLVTSIQIWNFCCYASSYLCKTSVLVDRENGGVILNSECHADSLLNKENCMEAIGEEGHKIFLVVRGLEQLHWFLSKLHTQVTDDNLLFSWNFHHPPKVLQRHKTHKTHRYRYNTFTQYI